MSQTGTGACSTANENKIRSVYADGKSGTHGSSTISSIFAMKCGGRTNDDEGGSKGVAR